MTTPVLRIGQEVKANSKPPYQGILRYLGTIDGVTGDYCGIELPTATGKNNGTAKGRSYFQCPPGHGVFVKKDSVVPVPATKSPAKRASIAPTSAASRSLATNPATKRTSVAPTSRLSTARQSISIASPVRKPTSRPTSQVITGQTPTSRGSRLSTQSTPRVGSPVKHVQDTVPEKQHDEDEQDEEDQAEDDAAEEQQEDDEPGPSLLQSNIQVKEMPPPTTSRSISIGQSSTLAQTLRDRERELEQHQVKLRVLEKKRQEDRDKLKEVDTLKSENERLTNIIQSMSAKMKKNAEERQAAQARIQELELEKQAQPETPAQLESELELATIDKEMAEEKADALEHELEEWKGKFEELELETEILKEENKELTTTMTDDEKAGAGWFHLERERDRLREALLMLRDHKQEIEADLREEIEHLRDTLNETEETASKYVDAAEQLQRVQDTNEQLREQLDAAENQEEVISTMMEERDRHLAQIEDLRASLSELEELAQTNEDLEKFYLDSERGLLSNIDEQQAMLKESEKMTNEKDQTIEDLEYTLNKFRSVMQSLQHDIDESRRTREISEIQAQEMKSRSKSMMELNMRLQSNASKSQTKAIEYEMVKSDALLQRKHAEILSLFLPESFDSDRMPILAFLTFSKLKTKASIVANMLSERLRDRGHLSAGDETLKAYRIVQSMQWISLVANRFERFMSTCSTSEFATFSNAVQEVEPVERAVTNWMESLKSDELGTESPEHMKRMESILADLVEKLLPNSAETKITQLLSETEMISTYSEVAAHLFDWLSRIVKSKLGDRNDGDDDDQQSIEFDRRLEQLSRVARMIKIGSSKATAELEKARTKNMCLEETTWTLFGNVEQQTSATIDQVQSLCRIVLNHLDEINMAEGLSYSSLLASLNNSSADMFNTLFNELKTLQEQMETLLHKASDASSRIAYEMQPAPWTTRAKEIKAQRLISSEVQEELSQSARKNDELVFWLTEKDKAIEEMSIRAALAEKRVKENKSKEGQDKMLKEELEKWKADFIATEAQLTETRTELSTAQEQSAKDKEKIAKLQAQAPQETANGTIVPASPKIDATTSEQTSAHVKALLAELAGLEATVRHLRWENRELSIPISETKFKAASQAWLDPSQLKHTRTKQGSRNVRVGVTQNDALDALLEISNSLSMKPVNLKSTWPKDNKWRSVKETTKWQVLRQREEVEAWDALRHAGADEALVVRVS